MAISNILLSKTKQENKEYFIDLEIYKDDIKSGEFEAEMDLWYIYKAKNNLKKMQDIKNKFVEKN